MRRLLRQIVPSMFHRRLILLALLAVGVSLVLSFQMARLTIVYGEELREEAASALKFRRTIPTVRGRILDRQGRVLAMDRPSHSIAVSYSVISGQWAYEQARREAYRVDRERWKQASPQQREQLIQQYLPVYQQQIDELMDTLAQVGGMSRIDLEQRKADVVRRVQQIATHYWLRRLEEKMEEEEDVTVHEVTQPVREQQEKHELVDPQSNDTLMLVRRMIAQASGDDPGTSAVSPIWRQVSVEDSYERDYPLRSLALVIDRSTFPEPIRHEQPVEVMMHDVASHLIGAMRPVWQEDAQRRRFNSQTDLGGYLAGDTMGGFGIEKSMENSLRGTRGLIVEYLDSGTHDRVEPSPGQDVVLSIDAQLQARIEALMDPQLGLMTVQPWHGKPAHVKSPQLGQPLYGAAIVMDVKTGQVLASVSTPSRHSVGPANEPHWSQTHVPHINKVIARPYQPGSTVKSLVFAAAVTDRKVGYDQTIVCDGHLFENSTQRYRCWIYKMFNSRHGPLAGDEAIMRSCNIFFYTLGQRLGPQRLAWWYNQFGIGHVTHSGLDEEIGGRGAIGRTIDEARFMGIGQGPVQWTLIQGAGAYATLARNGVVISPTFILSPQTQARPEPYDLHLDRHGVAKALEGLHRAVSERDGTGHHLTYAVGHNEEIFNAPDVKVYGKSGTAQASPVWVDLDRNNRLNREDEIMRAGDHAWFVGMVQRPGSSSPDYVIAVIVEYGGSGGRVAGPIANQIIHALRAEGYL